MGGENEAFVALKIDLGMVVSNAWILQIEPGNRITSHPERKTADNQLVARLSSGKHFKLDHYRMVRGT